MLNHDPVSLDVSRHEMELARRDAVMEAYELSIEERIDGLLEDPENVMDITDRICRMGKGGDFDRAILRLVNLIDRDSDHETVYDQSLKLHALFVAAAREIAKIEAIKEAVKKGMFT